MKRRDSEGRKPDDTDPFLPSAPGGVRWISAISGTISAISGSGGLCYGQWC